MLGLLYYEGKGVERDYEKAKIWYQKALESFESGQYEQDLEIQSIIEEYLGRCYHFSKNPNYVQAIYWYKKAAAKENGRAMYLLGDCYNIYNDNYEGSDGNIALYWYEKALEKSSDLTGLQSRVVRIDIIRLKKEGYSSSRANLSANSTPTPPAPKPQTPSGNIGNLTWILNNGTLTIKGAGEIPYIGNYDAWKAHSSSISAVVIENGVKSIGSFAFSDCENITSVSIPNSVVTIGHYAFSNCKNLKLVSIPNSVKSIEENTFQKCANLTSITIPNSVTSIGNYAFEYSGLTSVIIPNSVITIGKSVFYDCKNLSSVTIPNSVTTIGDYVFLGCDNLDYITLGNNRYCFNAGTSFADLDKMIKKYVKSKRPVRSRKFACSDPSSSGASSSGSGSSYKYKSNPLELKSECHTAGLSFGYVQKSWTYRDNEGYSEKWGAHEQNRPVHGIQAGVRIDPYFAPRIFGLGISTGVFYEYYYSLSKAYDFDDGSGQYKLAFQEHSISVPLNLIYRFDINERVGIFLRGGISVDIGINAKYDAYDGDYTIFSDESSFYTDDSYYDNEDRKRINFSCDFGGGIQIRRMLFDISGSKGISNLSSNDDYSVKQNKGIKISMTVMF